MANFRFHHLVKGADIWVVEGRYSATFSLESPNACLSLKRSSGRNSSAMLRPRFDLSIILIPRSKHGERRYTPINSAARIAFERLRQRKWQTVYAIPGPEGRR